MYLEGLHAYLEGLHTYLEGLHPHVEFYTSLSGPDASSEVLRQFDFSRLILTVASAR